MLATWARSKRVTQSEMGITNGIDVFTAQSGGVNVMPANNDNLVRIFDAEASCCHTCAPLAIQCCLSPRPPFCEPPAVLLTPMPADELLSG